MLGIVLMNISGFALPSGAYFNPRALGPAGPADLLLWSCGFIAVDGKMRALFSILFGASTALVLARAEAAGEDAGAVHRARMISLGLFGIAHWVLLWPGDILLHYALIGLLAAPFAALDGRRLWRLALGLLLLQALAQAWVLLGNVALRAEALAPHADPARLAQWRDFAANVGIGDPARIAAEIARQRGAWGGIVAANLATLAAGAPFLLLFNGPETLAYMLIGMALQQSGFFAGAWPRARYRRLGAWGVGLGLPLSALLCLLCWRSDFATLPVFAAATLGGVPLRPLLALGYAGWAVPRLGGSGRWARRLQAAGRMAFSNYLLTTLLMCALFQGWGLGLFARLDRGQLYALVPMVWALMLLWSPAWLRRFRYGPLEWMWRSLARGELQVFRRSIATGSH
ncbi:DUF418 domain-containing protein [Sphingomonas morindae]|uniref:DUF418 domain-containing protein n=1 Tax=Sphingomonas morindae TaxID=1541170 RepID=A0ABY4XAD7_9SPHN|nr:DUF418 domain-containing protein [Sphingomonas morindae]USI73646.1 DUF418 domain-containing protein [Sphingomonas morindae]